MTTQDATPATDATPETATTPISQMTVEAYSLTHVQRQVKRLADDLRDAADRIEREAAYLDRVGEGHGTKSYGSVAGSITQILFNTLANAGLNALVQTAAETDYYRGKGD